jgi:hypothetical protein
LIAQAGLLTEPAVRLLALASLLTEPAVRHIALAGLLTEPPVLRLRKNLPVDATGRFFFDVMWTLDEGRIQK